MANQVETEVTFKSIAEEFNAAMDRISQRLNEQEELMAQIRYATFGACLAELMREAVLKDHNFDPSMRGDR